MARTIGDVIDKLLEHSWRLGPGVSQHSVTHDDWRLEKHGEPPIFIHGTRDQRLSPTAVLRLLEEGGIIEIKNP